VISNASKMATDSPRSPSLWVPKTVVIRKITPEVENVATYHLAFTDADAAASYRFKPGQFNMLYMPGVGESAISISGDPESPELLDHTIRVAGNVTRGLTQLKPGDTLGLRGPFGSSWPMEQCVGRDVLLVTGGIGLPPLRPAIYQLLKRRQDFGNLHLLYGARSPDVLLHQNEFDDWKRSGLTIQKTVDRSVFGWKGNVGVVTLLLERLHSFDPSNTVLFCCGPEVMMRFVARTAFDRGLTAEQIWVSTERNMQCAVGLCGHCQLGPQFICKDGPVFRYDQIAPLLTVEGL